MGASVISSQDTERVLKKQEIINRLNYLNFSEDTLILRFIHNKLGAVLNLPARPDPCGEDSLFCGWITPLDSSLSLDSYTCRELWFGDGLELVTFAAESPRVSAEGIEILLPEKARVCKNRRIRRYKTPGISVKIIQKGVIFSGRLCDFTPEAFLVALDQLSGQSHLWLNPKEPVTLLMEQGGQQLFSCDSVITAWREEGAEKHILLSPKEKSIVRLKAKNHRSHRQKLNPPPSVRFIHPLTGKELLYTLSDVSGSGFSVEEWEEESLLLPGMVIPAVSIELAGTRIARCKAQVLYRNPVSEGDRSRVFRCGFVILEIPLQEQPRFSSLLHQAVDERILLNDSLDLEKLWRFFFESGFLYSSKYSALKEKREEFKNTYRRLYLESPSIARNFLYQEYGRICAHLSMLRFYSRSWLLQHHAAGGGCNPLAGVDVLDHVTNYINESHSLASANMDYLLCYFRPENKFPNKVFGGVARDINNPKAASLDTFAYATFSSLPGELAEEGSFLLSPAGDLDLLEFESFYEEISGGLLAQAMDLKAPRREEESLNREYKELGFCREREVFSLRIEGCLKALLTVSRSDLGLNLSNLTNCIHLFMVDSEGVSRRLLDTVLSQLMKHYYGNTVPLLIYPAEAADTLNIPVEKLYTLWIIDTQNEQGYFNSLRNTFKRRRYE